MAALLAFTFLGKPLNINKLVSYVTKFGHLLDQMILSWHIFYLLVSHRIKLLHTLCLWVISYLFAQEMSEKVVA